MDGEGAFFLYQLNVHTFNLEARSLNKAGGFNRRTDRRVEGCVRYGWIGGRREKVRGVYRFSSLVKQNKKGKNCAVFCFAGKRKIFFIYL